MYQRRIIHSRKNKGEVRGVFILKNTDKAPESLLFKARAREGLQQKK